MKKWWKEHPDKRDRRAYAKEYRMKNIDKVLSSHKVSHAKWRRENPEKYKKTTAPCVNRWKLYHIYAISEEVYQKMVIEQRGRCAICEDNSRLLCIDHDHTTKQVRGLLCSKCNSGLGFFKDNTILLMKAKDYLDRAAKIASPLNIKKEVV
jgi:hypothetical protein